MPPRDPLQTALDRIAVLEAELTERRSAGGASQGEDAARLRAEAALSELKREMDVLREQHEAQLDSLKLQHQAQLEAATLSTRAQIEHARMQSELQSVQLQAELVEQDRESYLEGLNALARELSEEIEVLLAFSREQAAAYYVERVARETAALAHAEEAHRAARRALAKKEAEAQASGQRTIAQMAEIDMALNLARAETQAAGVAVRDIKARLESLERKLARCRDSTSRWGRLTSSACISRRL